MTCQNMLKVNEYFNYIYMQLRCLGFLLSFQFFPALQTFFIKTVLNKMIIVGNKRTTVYCLNNSHRPQLIV